MKKIKYLVIITLFCSLFNTLIAQNINWRSLSVSQRNIISINAGFDNAFTAGVGYGYHLKSKLPVILNIEYSMPLGKELLDDLKTKIGAQAEVFKSGHFSTTVKAYGIIRRFDNDYARFINFGSEFSAISGYYKRQWYAAGELGFDKAIITHVKHSPLMKAYNPTLVNGWYIPTGGNFFFGIQGGLSLKKVDLNARVGKTLAQDFKSNALVPYYVQVGVNKHF